MYLTKICYNTLMIKQGDTVGIIALSGACEEELVKSAVLNFEKMGFKGAITSRSMELDATPPENTMGSPG